MTAIIYHSDHLGTPEAITDNTGNIIRQVDDDSWGVKFSDTNAGYEVPNRKRPLTMKLS